MSMRDEVEKIKKVKVAQAQKEQGLLKQLQKELEDASTSAASSTFALAESYLITLRKSTCIDCFDELVKFYRLQYTRGQKAITEMFFAGFSRRRITM